MRENFYNKIETREGIEIFDLGSIDWTDFKYTRRNVIHVVNQNEVSKPYIIAGLYYGDKDFWDIICLLNGVKDPLNVPKGTELVIPNADDISEFLFIQKSR